MLTCSSAADAPLWNRASPNGRSQRLEPDAGKFARPVLRGGGGGNVTALPDSGVRGLRVLQGVLVGDESVVSSRCASAWLRP
jgi:hypothetical protein